MRIHKSETGYGAWSETGSESWSETGSGVRSETGSGAWSETGSEAWSETGCATRSKIGSVAGSKNGFAEWATIGLFTRSKILIVSAIVILILTLSGVYAGLITSWASSDINARKERQKDVGNQLGEVRDEMKDARYDEEELEGDIIALDNIKRQSEMTLGELVELLAVYEEEIQNANAALADAEEQFSEQEAQVKTRIRNMYMNSNNSTLDILLGSGDLVSFMEKIELYSAISKYDREVLEDYKNACYDLEYKRSVKVSIEQDTQVLASERRKEIENLEMDREAIEAKLAVAQEYIDRLQRQEDELEKTSAQLEKEIKELTAKEAEKQKEAERQKAAKEAEKQKAATYSGGSMKWPTPGYTRITSNYGNRMHPVYKVMKKHTGIDIGAPKGASIVAAKGGTVIIAGWQGGYGNTVIIDHGGGITSLYGHCSKILVSKGDKVKEGAVIAKVGATGTATGNHLHFEVRSNGSPVNPIPKYVGN